MKKIKLYKKCRFCLSPKLKKVIRFNKTPIGDYWLNEKEKIYLLNPIH